MSPHNSPFHSTMRIQTFLKKHKVIAVSLWKNRYRSLTYELLVNQHPASQWWLSSRVLGISSSHPTLQVELVQVLAPIKRTRRALIPTFETPWFSGHITHPLPPIRTLSFILGHLRNTRRVLANGTSSTSIPCIYVVIHASINPRWTQRASTPQGARACAASWWTCWWTLLWMHTKTCLRSLSCRESWQRTETRFRKYQRGLRTVRDIHFWPTHGPSLCRTWSESQSLSHRCWYYFLVSGSVTNDSWYEHKKIG